MEKEVAKRLVARVRQMREERGLTQEALAEQAGLDYKHYQAFEAGRRLNFRFFTLVKLAKALSVELRELLQYVDHPAGALGEVPQVPYERNVKTGGRESKMTRALSKSALPKHGHRGRR